MVESYLLKGLYSGTGTVSCVSVALTQPRTGGDKSVKAAGFNYCSGCLKKQLEIDRLREENTHLRACLNARKYRAQEGFFGSSTPSSQVPVKPNTAPESSARQGGAKPGHPGCGRQAVPLA